jgi:hypothetical protein
LVRIPEEGFLARDLASQRASPASGQECEHERDVDTASDSTLLQALRSKEGLGLLTAVMTLGTAGVTAHTAVVQAKQAQTPVVQTRSAEPRSPGQSQPLAGSGDPTQMSDAERLALFGRFVGESLSKDRSQIARFQETLLLVTRETRGASGTTYSPLVPAGSQEAQTPHAGFSVTLEAMMQRMLANTAAAQRDRAAAEARKAAKRALRDERLLKQAEASEDAEASE